ncbi:MULTISPECIES: rhodanese-like domain-containing protein [Methylococcus]|jgi:rhodanese-related sulfurtransferase|uniref:Rhodanese-like domain n=2 Tax=Methylococcus capsulatus TaxID=414 RepID=Q607E4_METCA|nr:rhodanese-like domain-containing protein [Methylococcus capsulatus]AAU92147.1 rhodanese-like domain [Methylococcus capsulatus str. Bath]CAI8867975.1 phage shock protein E [Methylococcus capsulatus]
MALTPMDLVAAAKQRIREIGPGEVRTMLGDTLILDVREPEEYAAGHLPGAINIPRGVVEFRIETHPVFQGKKDAAIVVYCQSGLRSTLATDILQQLGWRGTVSMAGGFKAWIEGGLPVSS